ncbi:MAG: hypothetical protein BGO98_03440 [Myxococcales bacterium 68-20]|nr:MAG: hypothetical protein BGO98_03440 [Myxococcales bacterium 68-20]
MAEEENMSTTGFKNGIKTLNAQLWLLMASAEHLQAMAQQLAPLQRASLTDALERKLRVIRQQRQSWLLSGKRKSCHTRRRSRA